MIAERHRNSQRARDDRGVLDLKYFSEDIHVVSQSRVYTQVHKRCDHVLRVRKYFVFSTIHYENIHTSKF